MLKSIHLKSLARWNWGAGLIGVAALSWLSSCSKTDDRGERPVTPISNAQTQPAQTTQPAATSKASEPETKPGDTLPASRYDPDPPYRVELHVRSPNDPQPGWLRIGHLDADNSPASAEGTFPESNLMIVNTQNVQRIEVQFGDLPLAEKKRLILRIDGQGIELRRDDRRSVTLERRRTGVWDVKGAH